MTSRVLVLAHRGCPGPDSPENTVAAVAAALAGGADGAETDVRLTRDGALLCCHDPDLSRLAGRGLTVSDSTAAHLRRIRLAGGHALATLDEMLGAARRHGPCRVVVEAKPPSDAGSARRTAHALREQLPEFASFLDLTVSSFDAALLDSIRAALVGVPVRTALLGSPFTRVLDLLRQAVAAGHDEIHPHVLSVLRDPAGVETAHRLGRGVTCWTVNRRRHVTGLAGLGVDGVITDNAGAVRAMLSAVAISTGQGRRRPPVEAGS